MKNLVDKKILAIIPARGGSKRLPGKNIKDFLGKPLVAWTIEAALTSGVFDRVIVLTDSEEIATVAQKHGAEVPFLEPAELAEDTSYVADALRYTLQKLADDEGYEPENFIMLEPTAVGREIKHIREVAEILKTQENFDSLTGISEVPGHVSHLKQFDLRDDGIIVRVGDGAPLQSLIHHNQDIGKSHFINSAIYGFRRRNLFEGEKNLWGERTHGYLMDGSTLIDIDTPEEWQIAEIKMKIKLDLI
ncbi:MAG: acylneuraminate cytidylyltransferase family protein [Candidatus Paceibacterota bacterium]|jgi:CMP-N-acetylneuraminic acid synthetase